MTSTVVRGSDSEATEPSDDIDVRHLVDRRRVDPGHERVAAVDPEPVLPEGRHGGDLRQRRRRARRPPG